MKYDDKLKEQLITEEGQMTNTDRWKLALESVGDGVWDWNAQTNRVYFSNSWKAMLGFEAHEIGDTLDEWERRVHPEDCKRVYDAIHKHFEGTTSTYTSEHRVMCKDGTYKWILDRGQIISQTPDGKPLRVIGTHTDLTRLKLAENIIKTQRDLGISLSSTSDLIKALNFVLDAALHLDGIDSGGVYIIDPITGELNLMVHTGLSPIFIQSSSRYSADSPQAKLIGEGKPLYKQYKAIKEIINESSKIEKLLATAIIPVIYEGKVIAAFNIASHTHNDIPIDARNAIEDLATRVGCVIARIQAEQALHEGQQNMQTLLDTIDDMLFILDADGRLLKTNYSAQRCLGYTLHELNKLHVLDLHPPEQRQEASTTITDMLAGKLTTCEIPLVVKDGSYIPVETKVTRGKWGGRDVLFGISRDITERKKSEMEMKLYHEKLEDMVHVRTKELTKAYEQLKQENEVRRNTEVELDRRRQELEEMNTALRVILKQREEDKATIEVNVMSNHKVSILPYLEILERSNLNDDQKTFLSIIKSNLNVITSTFSRKISSGSLGLTTNEQKVASLIKEGKTSKEIAGLLNVSITTVNAYRRKIRVKTGLRNADINLRSFLQSLE